MVEESKFRGPEIFGVWISHIGPEEKYIFRFHKVIYEIIVWACMQDQKSKI